MPFREVLYKSLGKPGGAKQGLSQEVLKFFIFIIQWLVDFIPQ